MLDHRGHSARERLREPSNQVAMDAGFNDAAYFSLVFRKHTGVTPTDFQTDTPHG